MGLCEPFRVAPLCVSMALLKHGISTSLSFFGTLAMLAQERGLHCGHETYCGRVRQGIC